jgi:hypothetical protein
LPPGNKLIGLEGVAPQALSGFRIAVQKKEFEGGRLYAAESKRKINFGLCARIRETANWRRLERFVLPGIGGSWIPILNAATAENSAASERLEYWNLAIVRGWWLA